MQSPVLPKIKGHNIPKTHSIKYDFFWLFMDKWHICASDAHHLGNHVQQKKKSPFDTVLIFIKRNGKFGKYLNNMK
jgi:hypothetical protein